MQVLSAQSLLKRALPQSSLTVVIPAFNEAGISGLSERVLRSHQPCSDLSVVVVDDASDDQTLSLPVVQRRKMVGVVVRSCRPAHDLTASVGWKRTGPAPERWSRSAVIGSVPGCRCASAARCTASRPAPSHRRRIGSVQSGPAAGGDVGSRMVQRHGQPARPRVPGEAAVIRPRMWPSLQARSCSFRARPTTRSVVTEAGRRSCRRPALARRIKTEGFQLSYRLGLDAVRLRMYRDLPSYGRGGPRIGSSGWTAASSNVGGRMRWCSRCSRSPGCFCRPQSFC